MKRRRVCSALITLVTVTCRSPDPPAEVKPLDDLRRTTLERDGRYLAGMDLRDKSEVLQTVTFDTRTKWPPKDRMPVGFDPARLLEVGADPGLGIRSLHAAGITGRGVKVAMIDQPLLLGHREYADKIEMYTPIACAEMRPQMHGAAMASHLVGETCGVAPGAALYFWAEALQRDHANRIEAMKQILAYNEGRPPEQRIRVVSISIGFAEDFANAGRWKETLGEVERRGMIVVHCGERIFGARCPIGSDRDNPANYTTCYYRERFKDRLRPGLIYVPTDNRTEASYEGEKDYVFFAGGGMSPAAPYLAGVIALALQVNPTLDVDQVWRLLRESGDPFEEGWIVNPRAFVDRAAKTK